MKSVLQVRKRIEKLEFAKKFIVKDRFGKEKIDGQIEVLKWVINK